MLWDCSIADTLGSVPNRKLSPFQRSKCLRHYKVFLFDGVLIKGVSINILHYTTRYTCCTRHTRTYWLCYTVFLTDSHMVPINPPPSAQDERSQRGNARREGEGERGTKQNAASTTPNASLEGQLSYCVACTKQTGGHYA